MNFQSITKHFRTRNLLLFLVIIGTFIIFGDGVALAKEGATGASDAGDQVVSVIHQVFKGIAAIIGLITGLVSLLLYPGWVNGEIFDLNVPMKSIWILVSNVVYFLFAFILIWIAFMNILGKGKDKYELKAALPKFIVGVLIVPISWFFVQFVLSISAFLTVAVLTLPYDTFKNYDFFTSIEESSETICVKYKLNLGKINSGAKEEVFGCDKEAKDSELTISEIFNGTKGSGSEKQGGLKNSIFGLISIYTYGIMSLDKLDVLVEEDLSSAGSIGTILDLGLKVIFDLIFILMYMILLIALFMALFARGVWLWVYTMLSPVFGLMYFFDKTDEGVGSGETKFSVKEFISLAMVPVLVSAALSFGLLFLFVIGHGMEKTETAVKDEISVGGFTLEIIGATGGGGKGDKGGFVGGAMLNGVGGALGNLIVQMFGLAILWMSVIAALKSSGVTGKVIEPIEQFGKSVGTLVMKSPQYAPIIPTFDGKGGRMGVAGLGRAAQTIESGAQAGAQNKGQQFVDNITGGVGNEHVKKMNVTAASIDGNMPLKPDGMFYQKFGELLKGSNGEMINVFNTTFRDSLKRMGVDQKKNYGIEGLDLDNENQFAQAIEKILDVDPGLSSQYIKSEYNKAGVQVRDKKDGDQLLRGIEGVVTKGDSGDKPVKDAALAKANIGSREINNFKDGSGKLAVSVGGTTRDIIIEKGVVADGDREDFVDLLNKGTKNKAGFEAILKEAKATNEEQKFYFNKKSKGFNTKGGVGYEDLSVKEISKWYGESESSDGSGIDLEGGGDD